MSWALYSFVKDSNRLAVFTASPMAVREVARPYPISPTMTAPLCNPMPMRSVIVGQGSVVVANLAVAVAEVVEGIGVLLVGGDDIFQERNGFSVLSIVHQLLSGEKVRVHRIFGDLVATAAHGGGRTAGHCKDECEGGDQF